MMTIIPGHSVIYHGGHPGAKKINLRAGNLSLIYEAGNFRYISVGNREIIRMIYSAVRDSEWLTILPELSNEIMHIDPYSFIIKYSCRYSTGEIDFSADYSIEGRSDNTIVFTFEGEALKTFKKNRIGFCVLHPVEGFAGKSCTVIHTDGVSENLIFPQYISPHKLFKDIKSMQWVSGRMTFRIDFERDIFETEDQRNWTDASYKTYCTPLAKPYPVVLKKGERISQRVTFKVTGESRPQKIKKEPDIRIFPGETYDLPKIGTARTTRLQPITENEICLLRNLRFDHYRVDLYLSDNNWKFKALLAAEEARKLGYSLEPALFFDDDTVTRYPEVKDLFSSIHTDISLFILLHKNRSVTPDGLTNTIAPLLRADFQGVKIACGTNANFARINRNRPVTTLNDYISYPVYPQEHASDNLSLTENLKGMEYTVESAYRFSQGKGIWISPVNIQRRFNPNITNYEPPQVSDEIPSQVDSRLMSLYGACWTVGSLKYLCESGVKGITFYETAGERGIIQGDYDSRWPDRFPATRGMIFPVFFIFRYLSGLREMKIIKSVSSSPLYVDCLAFTDGRQIRMILINYSSEKRQVFITGCNGLLRVRELNAENYCEAANNYLWRGEKTEKSLNCSEKLRIEPFSISFIEGLLK
jgi:hypothetical protein